MALQVIGAGMGRTGTSSLKAALEILGYNKCYHMVELIQDPSRLQYWMEAEKTGQTDWDKLFEGYTAAVDFPPCNYYIQLMEKYPEAKVILTVRDPQKWYVSAYNTIYQQPEGFNKFKLQVIATFVPKVRGMFAVLTYAKAAIWDGRFKGKFEDRQFATQLFQDWNEEVKKNVPADKLLVFDAKEGWEPLCRFLNVPIPEIPYPRINDTQEFNQRRRFLMKPKLLKE